MRTPGSLASLALAALVAATSLGPASAATPGTRRVGTLDLVACGPDGRYCGSIDRALDPAGRVPGTLAIHFEYYPARGPGPRTGTLVATEGGPGYPATLSRADYLALFEPLRADHDVVIMDNRGTGGSGAVDCAQLERAPAFSSTDIGACGASLGERAPLYGTVYAADDLEALLAALEAGTADLYGDSYGTFFAQVFAVLHPDRLRSLILDGAYPLDGPDLAWYPAYAPAMRAKFERACERSPWCAAGGPAFAQLAPALARLRARPAPASAVDADGVRRRFEADATRLAVVLFGSAPAYATLRESVAAARAFGEGDGAPLLRLMAEATAAVDSRDPGHDVRVFSAGLAAAVTCGDTPQIFDMGLAPAERREALDAALARRRAAAPDTYAPFTIDEFRGMPPDYAFIDECVGWPARDAAREPAYRAAAARGYPAVPTLVISGEFDNMTTVADGAMVAEHFPRARQVVLRNSGHVNALPRARSRCGADLARRFIATLEAGDAGCAQAVPPLRLAPPFVRTFNAVEPAVPLAGNDADERLRRAAAAAVYTAGDLLGRIKANSSGRGAGLRGGTFRVTSAPGVVRAHLTDIRWTDDLRVSGTLELRSQDDDAGTARLHLRTDSGLVGDLDASWPAGGADARARLTGRIGGRAIVAEVPAP